MDFDKSSQVDTNVAMNLDILDPLNQFSNDKSDRPTTLLS